MSDSSSKIYKENVEYRDNIDDQGYPPFEGHTMNFLEERLPFGKIDHESDPVVILDPSVLAQIKGEGNGTVLVCDFVADAFAEFRMHMMRAATNGSIVKKSILTDLRGSRGWSSVADLYHSHLKKLYDAFIKFLDEDGRGRNVTNFEEFMQQFMHWSYGVAKGSPITRTGFIASTQCPVSIGGLTIELKSWNHDSKRLRKIYIEDPNFKFYRNAARKFGFMVDKYAPWRLTCNLSSHSQWETRDTNGELTGETSQAGTRFYMSERLGILDRTADYRDLFNLYYSKSYIEDLDLLSTYLFLFYQNFVEQFPVAVKLLSGKCGLTKIQVQRYNYSQEMSWENQISYAGPPTNFTTKYNDVYWIQKYLELRVIESGVFMSPSEYRVKAKRALKLNFNIDRGAALDYINRETKGYIRNQFAAPGKFWHGYQEAELSQIQSRPPSNVVSTVRGVGASPGASISGGGSMGGY
tara:strand:- start:7459 stop:8856 length:1398 start_codon:yes stop_codon:yes gene_type:complete